MLLAGRASTEPVTDWVPRTAGGKNTISLRSLFTETIPPQEKNSGSWMLKLHSFTFPQKDERSVLAKIGQHLKFCIKSGKAGLKHADLLTKDNFKFSLQLSPSSWESWNFNALWKLGVKTV